MTLLGLLGVSGSFPRGYIWAGSGGILLLSGMIAALLGGKTIERLATIDLVQQSGGLEARVQVYQRILHALEDAPLFGTGYGTFADVFRMYQGTTVDGFWDHAHNTYLENAMELGVPSALALLMAIGGVIGVCLKKLRRRDSGALYPCLGLAATLQVGTHAFFDFSLEMPGVAITYAALLGTGCAQSLSSARESTAIGNGCSQTGSADVVRVRSLARIVAPGYAMMRHCGPAALPALVGLTLLGLAVPHSVAAFLTLPDGLTASIVRQGGVVRDPAVISAFITRQVAAARWLEDGRFWSNIAAAKLNRSSPYGIPAVTAALPN
jgi:O-Antigen ligase